MTEHSPDPWQNGEAAAWLLLSPALGVAFAWAAALPYATDAAVVLIATFVGLICGLVMMPVMILGAWRRNTGIAALLQLVGGAVTAGVSSGLIGANSRTGGSPVIAILFTAAAVVVIAVITRVVLPRRPGLIRRAGRCSYCGYDVRGLTSDICPECGAATP